MVVPAPGTSMEALCGVVYTAGQASMGRLALAGSVDGRLRMASGYASSHCVVRMSLSEIEGGIRLGRSEACPVAPEAFESHSRAVAAACLERLDVVAAEVFAEHPDLTPPDPASWRCIGVDLGLDGGQVDTVLPIWASMASQYPDLRHGHYLPWLDLDKRPCRPVIGLDEVPPEALDWRCSMGIARTHLTAAMEGLSKGRSWGEAPSAAD